MKHQIIIQIREVGEGQYDSEIGMQGDVHLLARAIGAGLRREEKFRVAVMEAIDNLLAGYQMNIKDKGSNDMPVDEPKKAD